MRVLDTQTANENTLATYIRVQYTRPLDARLWQVSTPLCNFYKINTQIHAYGRREILYTHTRLAYVLLDLMHTHHRYARPGSGSQFFASFTLIKQYISTHPTPTKNCTHYTQLQESYIKYKSSNSDFKP